MPIDVYAPDGVFPQENTAELLRQLTECLLRWTDAADIPIARNNTGAYLHVLPPAYITAGGAPTAVVRVDVKIPEVVLSTLERRRGFIADATQIVSSLSGEKHDAEHTWITVANTVDGGWGIGGRSLTNADLDEL
jgi:phenylpyruvate tautomerase PptA (4-oxalocrotonate tautomerase family)